MVVTISNNVWRKINDYATALTTYPITTARLIEKVDALIAALNGLGSSISVPPICRDLKLGQTFNANGSPNNTNLRRFNYKDKSKFQWAFACHYDFDNNTIIIVEMMAASFVTESLEKVVEPIIDFMQRLSLIK